MSDQLAARMAEVQKEFNSLLAATVESNVNHPSRGASGDLLICVTVENFFNLSQLIELRALAADDVSVLCEQLKYGKE